MQKHITADIGENGEELLTVSFPKNIQPVTADLEEVSIGYSTEIKYATTEEWNSQPRRIAQNNTLYVYTDYRKTADGQDIPGFKVGDGKTYLIDLPFSDAATMSEGYIQSATTAEWNAQSDLVSVSGVLYVYTDHTQTSTGEEVPAYKIGDGNSYLIDLPFSDALLTDHINNRTVHITAEEREFWNNKVTAYIADSEELVLSKDFI